MSLALESACTRISVLAGIGRGIVNLKSLAEVPVVERPKVLRVLNTLPNLRIAKCP